MKRSCLLILSLLLFFVLCMATLGQTAQLTANMSVSTGSIFLAQMTDLPPPQTPDPDERDEDKDDKDEDDDDEEEKDEDEEDSEEDE